MDDNILSGPESNEQLLDDGIGERYYKILLANEESIVQVDSNTGNKENSKSFRRKAVQIAFELLKLKLKAADILVLCCKNRPEESVILLGSLFVGIQVAILDPEMEFDEIKHVFNLLKPKVIFCDIRMMVNIDRALGLDNCIVYTFKESAKYSIIRIFDMEITEDFLPVKIKNPKKTTALIVATEGVNARPKLVKISHCALFARIKTFASLLTEDITKIISYYPLTGSPQTLPIFACLEKNKILVIPKDFVTRDVSKIIHDMGIEFGVFGTIKAIELAVYHTQEEDYDLSCLKHILVGGSPTYAHMMTYISTSFDKSIVNIYAIVECGFISGVTPEDSLLCVEKPSSSGKLFPGVSIKIGDFKTNEPVGLDTWGELSFRGPSLALGYFNGKDDDFLFDEYFRTGDVAQYDDQGCLYIHGRLDEIFISKGKVFSAMDIEEVINTHPNIIDAVTISNGRYLIAFVIMENKNNISSKEILRWMQQKLPSQMVPNKVYVLNEIPKTRNGKVKKYALESIIARRSIINFD